MLFYDFEVFKYDWLVVIIDMVAKKKTVIIMTRLHLKRFTKHTSMTFGLVSILCIMTSTS